MGVRHGNISGKKRVFLTQHEVVMVRYLRTEFSVLKKMIMFGIGWCQPE